MRVVNQMAEALGGRERVMAVKSVRIVGYGELAYHNGGGNITGHPEAPQKWRSVVEYERTIDLDNWRTRVRQRVKNHFVFASFAGQLGLERTNEVLDGDVAYNVVDGPGGPQFQRAGDAVARQRRMDLLSHPLTIVRAALDPSAKLGNLRSANGLQLVDVTLRQGDTLTLAADGTSHLPAWISYVAPNVNLGDLTLRVAFVGYIPVNGIQMPTGTNAVMDWRNVVQSKIYVDRNYIDEPVADMAAPQSVRTGPAAQGAQGQNANLQPVKVADHVYYINGNTVFEFDDHLTMFEANRGEGGFLAVLKVANALVPGKRVTQVIQSHHHFDHSTGLRTAVAEGLTIIARRGNEGIFREMTSRPATLFPDALGRRPAPLKFIPVDDHLKLKDSTNEVDIYHIIGNYHMADGVIAHVPASRLLVEADLTTQNWDMNWWGDGYLNNIEHRKIQVDTNLAVHGQQPVPIGEVTAAIERQVRNAQALCRKAADAQLFLPGCPIQYDRPLSQGTQ